MRRSGVLANRPFPGEAEATPSARRRVLGIATVGVILLGAAWVNSAFDRGSSGVPSAGSTVADTQCAREPRRTEPTRDAWLVIGPDGVVSIDDFAGTRTQVAELDVAGLADDDGRLTVDARRDGDVAWIVATMMMSRGCGASISAQASCGPLTSISLRTTGGRSATGMLLTAPSWSR